MRNIRKPRIELKGFPDTPSRRNSLHGCEPYAAGSSKYWYTKLTNARPQVNSIAVDKFGFIYIVAGFQLYKFSPDGVPLYEIVITDVSAGTDPRPLTYNSTLEPIGTIYISQVLSDSQGAVYAVGSEYNGTIWVGFVAKLVNDSIEWQSTITDGIASLLVNYATLSADLSIYIVASQNCLYKIDNAGNLLWGVKLYTGYSITTYGLATDSGNNVYVVGMYYTSFNASVTSQESAFYKKYANNGSLQITRGLLASGGNRDTFSGICIDVLGKVYLVTGSGTTITKVDSTLTTVDWAYTVNLSEGIYPIVTVGNPRLDSIGNVIWLAIARKPPGTQQGQDKIYLFKTSTTGKLLWSLCITYPRLNGNYSVGWATTFFIGKNDEIFLVLPIERNPYIICIPYSGRVHGNYPNFTIEGVSDDILSPTLNGSYGAVSVGGSSFAPVSSPAAARIVDWPAGIGVTTYY